MIVRLAALAMVLLASSALACDRETITGRVSHVRDGDTIELGEMAIRLQGLAAPEWNEPGGRQGREAMIDEQRQQRLRELADREEELRRLGRIEPVPLLLRLRDVVLRERHDRCPRWRFRLAPDLACNCSPGPVSDAMPGICSSARSYKAGRSRLRTSPAARRGAMRAWLHLELGVLPSARDPIDPMPGQWLIQVTAGPRDGSQKLLVRLIDSLRQLDQLDGGQDVLAGPAYAAAER